MVSFTSARERRLWLWTLAVVTAIFSPLGLARTLARWLEGTGIGETLFAACCVIVLLAIVTQGLTSRPGPAEVAVALGVMAAYLLVFARMSVPTERSHLIEYGIVAMLIYEALQERVRQGSHVRLPGLLAILLATAIGLVDEGIQAILPDRFFDPIDLGFNALAAAMAVGTSASLAWARGGRHSAGESRLP